MLNASLIIVNFQSEAHVRECVAHLRPGSADCPAQLIVIDNSPERGLVQQLAPWHATLEYVAASHNIGFAAAVNMGMRRIREETVILLNPDARPELGCLPGLLDILSLTEGAAVAGPALLPFDRTAPVVPSATRRDPGLITSLIEYTIVRRLVSGDWLAKHYFLDPRVEKHPIECAMVQGACFAFRRKWSNRVGDFDADRFFLYWEDTDFCRRVRKAGGTVLYCPNLHCRHLGGASMPNGAEDVQQFWRGFYAYNRKHVGVLRCAVLRLLLTGGMAAEYLLLSGLRVSRRDRDPRLASDHVSLRARLREQTRR